MEIAVIIVKPISKIVFAIDFVIQHSIFGRTFSYLAHFSITESDV